jgi:hypothetical protein
MFTPDPTDELQALDGRDRALAAAVGVPLAHQQFTIQAAVSHSLGAPADGQATPWRQWGARNIGGRVRDLAQDPQNPSTWYAGSGMGGVFRSTDGGDTWSPLGKPQDSFPVGALAILPTPPGGLLVGTGEPVLQGATAKGPAGRGLFRYDPAANTFVPEAPAPSPPGAPPPPGTLDGASYTYARIVVDPSAAGGRCWIASEAGLWRREPGPRLKYVAESQLAAGRVTDVVVIPDADPAATTRRLIAGVAGVGVFRGTYRPGDAVANWDKVLDLPADANDRIRLAYCAGYPNHIYAVVGAADGNNVVGVYRSNDGGSNWTHCKEPDITWAGVSPYVWWTMCVGVHPNNPAIVLVGGINVVRSLDFGETWDVVIDWTLHTVADRAQHGDNHVLVFDAEAPNRLYIGNDGGISVTADIANSNPSRSSMTLRAIRTIRSYSAAVSRTMPRTSPLVVRHGCLPARAMAARWPSSH